MSFEVRTAADIKEALAAGYQKGGVTDFNVGGLSNTIVEETGNVVSDIYPFGVSCDEQGFMLTATGVMLEAACANYKVFKLPGAKAKRTVILGRNATAGTVFIGKDTIVQSRKDVNGNQYRYLTIQDYSLAVGVAEVEVIVEAEVIGVAYNTPTISVFGTTVSGLDYITDNAVIESEGADLESDSRLRRRGFLAWDALTRGSTAAAYLLWALSDVRVAQAWIDMNGPRGEGTINVYVVGAGGAPSEDPGGILDTLRKYIIGTAANNYEDGMRPAGDDSWVLGPTTQSVDITFTLERYADFTETEVDTEVRAILTAYFSVLGDELYEWLRPLGVGRNVVYSQIVENGMRPDGVYRLTGLILTSDGTDYTDDVPIAQGILPELGTVTITHRAISV